MQVEIGFDEDIECEAKIMRESMEMMTSCDNIGFR